MSPSPSPLPSCFHSCSVSALLLLLPCRATEPNRIQRSLSSLEASPLTNKSKRAPLLLLPLGVHGFFQRVKWLNRSGKERTVLLKEKSRTRKQKHGVRFYDLQAKKKKTIKSVSIRVAMGKAPTSSSHTPPPPSPPPCSSFCTSACDTNPPSSPSSPSLPF